MRNKYVYNKYQELQFLNISVLSGDESLINNHFKPIRAKSLPLCIYSLLTDKVLKLFQQLFAFPDFLRNYLLFKRIANQ